MKNIFVIYDTSCFYEIVILNYFMSVSGWDVLLCSLDGKAVRTMEGYLVNADAALGDIRREEIGSLIVPGGDISKIDREELYVFLRELKERGVLIGGICAGVDLLEKAGILEGVKTTHSADLDIANDHKVITARGNAYVDFAIEVGKELGLFTDEADLNETVNFWKYHQRAEEIDA
ncbi:MAG: DJ-1/PfpI family protein [Lachnospiraceae bacterium]|nr:DJ-1/PfpI family protein [Lachnospiraceae bacterium]